jgi:hypothetical protein
MIYINFFQYAYYLYAKVLKVYFGKEKYRLMKIPMEKLSNVFTLLFETLLMELICLMPVRQVTGLYCLADHKLWALMK